MDDVDEEKRTVPPDYWAIALDETKYYNIDPEDRPLIERILGIYFFDRNVHTHCCEITPSYWLEYHSASIHFRDDVSENDRDRLDYKYGHEPSEGSYYHVAAIESMPADRKHQIGEVENDDAAREVLNGCNPF